jgi:hypothetical protein
VFVAVPDPVGAGLIESMGRPGGNATGFVQSEYTLSGKWLELLKEIAPSVTRTAVLRDPLLANAIGQYAVIQSVAPALGVDVTVINLRDAGEIERAVTAFAGSPNGGLIVTTSALAVAHHELIIALAAKHKLPAVYWRRSFVASGGLISYGYDILQQFRGRLATSTASLRARSRRTFRRRPRPSTSWSSILRPPRRLASKCRRRYSPEPTRSSSKSAMSGNGTKRTLLLRPQCFRLLPGHPYFPYMAPQPNKVTAQ